MRTMTPMTQHSAITLRYDDLGSGHPSGLWLLFDVELRNGDDEPRWFVLPRHVHAGEPGGPEPPDAPPFSVIAVEVWRLNARTSIPLVHFVGSEGFQALLLPACATLRVRRLPIVWFGPVPDGVAAFRCAIADDIQIEDESVAAWLGADVTAPAAADADYDERDLIASRKSSTGKEQPVTLIGVRPLDITTHITLRK
jgi:hypothetical protein